jgi:hypothetical protein
MGRLAGEGWPRCRSGDLQRRQEALSGCRELPCWSEGCDVKREKPPSSDESNYKKNPVGSRTPSQAADDTGITLAKGRASGRGQGETRRLDT